MKTDIYIYIYIYDHILLSSSYYEIFLRENCRENQNTHFTFSNFFFSKMVPFMRYVEKYCIPGQATDDNTAHAL